MSEDAGQGRARALEDAREHELGRGRNFDVRSRAADLFERALEQERDEAFPILLVSTALRPIEQHDHRQSVLQPELEHFAAVAATRLERAARGLLRERVNALDEQLLEASGEL